jgi:hypothetical protein
MPQCKIEAHLLWGKCTHLIFAERAICDLSESVRKQLLHTCARWPEAVHFTLWPYALRNAAHLHNSLLIPEDGTSRLELFSPICVSSNMKHVHTFGCPVFALQNMLASGNQLLRWSPRAHLRLNLGPSPMHARKVHLVLNLITRCVSPQYHCCFDGFFKTTRHGAPDVSGTVFWQQLDCATTVLFKVSVPKQHSVISLEMPSEEEAHTMSKLIFEPPMYAITSDDYSVSDRELHVSENT